MHIRFDNVTVAVTGAGHGFGQAIARVFAALGARVFACDLSATELTETAKAPGAITIDAFDLTAKGAAAGWIKRIEDNTGGPIEILISNAGGVRGQVMRPIEEVSDEDFHAPNENWREYSIAEGFAAWVALLRALHGVKRAAFSPTK